MQAADLFHALGEPTRLKMVERLSRGGSCTITSLSEGLKISRQGARKHIQILEDSNIVILVPQGRTTTVALDRHALEAGKKFIEKLELRWERRLKALRDFVDKKQ